MNKRLLALLAILVAAALAVTACGTDETPVAAGGGDSTPAAPEDGLVLRVERAGGFVMRNWAFSSIPQISVYADGTVLSPGAVIAIYPGPVLTPVQSSTVSADAIAALLAEADELGLLGDPVDAGMPGVADAGATVVTIRTSTGTYTQSAEALLEAAGVADTMLSEDQRAFRADLAAFVAEVERLAVDAEPGELYTPTSYRLLAEAVTPPVVEAPEPQPRLAPWPVELLAPALIGDCAEITDDAALLVRKTFEAADQLTFFTDADGGTWQISVRPALPDDPGC